MTAARGILAGWALALLLSTAQADAQNSAASAAAEKLFREGKSLSAAAKYDDAIAKFRASQELEPSVGVLLSLGDAYRALGKVASAWSAYVSATDLARARGDSRVADAEQRAADVSARVARLTIRLAVPIDVSVSDNGLTLPAASLGSSLPVDPGPHVIVATAKGRRTFRATEDLVEGRSSEVLVPVLERDEPSPVTAPEADRSSTRRTLVPILLIGGGITTVAGLVFGAFAVSKWSSVTTACPERQCDTATERESARGDARSAQGFATVSTVAVAVGTIALGTGLVLHLTAPSKTLALSTTVGVRTIAIGGSFP